MYCNNCGKHNPEGSKFCKYCGAKIIKLDTQDKTDNNNQIEVSSSEEDKNTLQNNEKVHAGLGGWLALVGLSLILNPILQGYGLLPYLQYLNQTYNIPGFSTLIQFEFIMSIAYIIASIYLIYLYFKKNIKFPNYYIVFLIATIVFVVVDHMWLASLAAPTPEQQKMITDAVTNNTNNVIRTIFFAIIWIAYMKNSKQVKVTFINRS
jgi:hypothetical protein